MSRSATAARLVSGVLGWPAARAVPACKPMPERRVLRSRCGVLESAIVDAAGRLFFTSQTWNGWRSGALLRMDNPDAEPVPVTTGIASPGGLAFADDGRLIVGYGDSPIGGLSGNVVPRAGMLLVDPDSGSREIWVRGLGMANGVARAPDGTVFASNDLGTHIDCVTRDGTVHRRWARVLSANGLAVDTGARYLYAAQTFTRPAIKRIEIARPGRITTFAQGPPVAALSMLDGIAIDDADRVYVAANGAGQIWRINRDGTICAIARGLGLPSAIALGRGKTGFHAGNAYVVGFGGDIIELASAVATTSRT